MGLLPSPLQGELVVRLRVGFANSEGGLDVRYSHTPRLGAGRGYAGGFLRGGRVSAPGWKPRSVPADVTTRLTKKDPRKLDVPLLPQSGSSTRCLTIGANVPFMFYICHCD